MFFIEGSEIFWGKYAEVVVGNCDRFNDAQLNSIIYVMSSVGQLQLAQVLADLLMDRTGFGVEMEKVVAEEMVDASGNKFVPASENDRVVWSSIDARDPFFQMYHSLKLVSEGKKSQEIFGLFGLC